MKKMGVYLGTFAVAFLSFVIAISLVGPYADSSSFEIVEEIDVIEENVVLSEGNNYQMSILVRINNNRDYAMDYKLYADCYEGMKVFDSQKVIVGPYEDVHFVMRADSSDIDVTSGTYPCSIHVDSEYGNSFEYIDVNVIKE